MIEQVEYLKIAANGITAHRERGKVERGELLIGPCPECRALVLQEDLAEHMVRAHDSYYPDPRAELVDYHIDADQIEVGDVLLSEKRLTRAVDKVERLGDTVRVRSAWDQTVDYDVADLVRVLRRDDRERG